MKFVIPSGNVKILRKAIYSLAKLGNELYVESTTQELTFRTLNPGKTAFACFSFNSSFFTYFDDKSGDVKCQISMKSSLAVFKSPIEKTVESCEIKLQPNVEKLIFILKFKRGVVKTFHIPIIERECLNAFYIKDNSPNFFSVEAKVIANVLHNFSVSQDEITFNALKDKLVVTNFADGEEFVGIRTELTVSSVEFCEYKVTKENELIFCLKELRAILSFAESFNLPIIGYFSVPSKPLIFSVKNIPTFEANFVVSTSSIESSQLTQESQLVAPVQHSSRTSIDKRPSSLVNGDSSAQNASEGLRKEFRHIFGRCFQSQQFQVENIPGFNEILVPDSDPEDEN